MAARISIRVAAVAAVIFLSLAIHADEPEATVRTFYESLAGGDFITARQMLAADVGSARLFALRNLHRLRCVSLAELRLGEVQIEGERVTVPVTATFTSVDPLDGSRVVDVEHSILGLIRIVDRWNIDSWTFEEDKLAEAVLAAKSDAEADALLAKRPDLFDALLLRALRVSGTNFINRQELDNAARAASSLHRLAAMTGDDEVLSAAEGIDSAIADRRTPPQVEEGVLSAERGLIAARHTGKADAIGIALYNLARAYQWRDGTTLRAVPLLQEQFALRPRYFDENNALRAATLLCLYYLENGEYRNCFPYVTAAKEIATESRDTLGLYSVEMVLANLFTSNNDCALALPHFERGRDLADQAHFVGSVAMRRGVAHCALVLGRDKEFHAAVDDLLKRRDFVDNASLSALWIDISVDALRRGDLAAAERAALEMKRLADLIVEDQNKANADEMLARIRLAQKRYAEALELADDAIVHRKKGDSVSQLSAWILAARAHLGLGDREGAYAALRAAIRYGEIQRAASGGTERQIALLFEQAAEAHSMLVDLLVEDGQPREAFLVAENAKARTLLDILDGQRSFAEAELPRGVVEEERAREKQLVEANTKGERAAIDKARLELETLRSIIDADHPRLRGVRGAGELPSIESLAPLLSDDRAAIVEYVLSEERLHMFIVRRGEKEPRVDVRTVAIGRQKLEQLANRYAEALSSQDLSYANDARRLYALLLAPLDRVAPLTRDLCVIPDGALWRFPFESLIAGQGGFAIEKRSFFYAPSAAVLLREHRNATPPKEDRHVFLGIGDPRLEVSRESLAPSERATSLAPIPEAAREVETIAGIIGAGSSTVFVGAEALESRAKAEAPRFRIVHLATHGVLDDANPMYSRLLLARREGDGEDGVLEAREMLDFHLQADLVVLSACDTARGDVHAGEGLIGMSWTLFAAGSPSVIASQWRVGSARTETLMTTFYRRWMARPGAPFGKARALRDAKLALLRDPGYRHPYHWAPFVLIGSSD